MKKKWFLISTIIITLLILSPITAGTAEKAGIEADKAFIFPSSLVRIEDEAFVDTAAETVVFPEGLLSIGSRAFENTESLTDIYIPATTEYIADSALPITQNLTIHGLDNSYAKEWAYQHGVPFVVDNIWNAVAPNAGEHNTRPNQINRFIPVLILILLFGLYRFGYEDIRSRRQQDRPELFPLNYRFP